MKEALLQKIEQRTIIAGVIGLGYVGLPLAVEKAKAGFRTIGFDIQKGKVDMVNAGKNYIGDVVDSELSDLVRTGRLSATNDFSFIRDVDFVAICVPTPLDAHQQPDISYVESSAKAVAGYLHPGMMVVLESTTYPGTTEELIRPILESTGLRCGTDFYLGFSPERVDPGNRIYKTKNTPKVVGCIGDDATEVISAMYEAVLESPVFRASSPSVAEMTKILENTYRNINIGLINEMAILCHKMGIDLWEVIEAAKTKPFGFTPFYPGPGLGGHCIPLDPYYLSWKAREYGFHTSMIESSMMINDRMPDYVVERVGDRLNHRFAKALKGSRILVLGVAYKQDIDDYRESPAVRVIEGLRKEGAEIVFYDPHIPRYRYKGNWYEGLADLTAEDLERADAVVITTAHTTVDYAFVQRHSKAVFDTKNVTRNLPDKSKVEIL
ncbi:MAG: nucleotide sugar dehydrogenase [Bacteroidales bacterium]|nr:nucleotide sugar dehydrogenase [Bacteroidales bacterium]